MGYKEKSESRNSRSAAMEWVLSILFIVALVWLVKKNASVDTKTLAEQTKRWHQANDAKARR